MLLNFEHLMLALYCFLASVLAGFASLLTNGRAPVGEGVFSLNYLLQRLLIALSIGFPTFFLAHKYILNDEIVIASVWATSFVGDLALPHLKQILLKIFIARAESTLNQPPEN